MNKQNERICEKKERRENKEGKKKEEKKHVMENVQN